METTLLAGLAPMTLDHQTQEQFVGPSEFCELLLSHRRMERFDRRDRKVRGLRDLDTGEVFLTDARRLMESRR